VNENDTLWASTFVPLLPEWGRIQKDMKRSALLACFFLGHSEDALAWVQSMRTRAPTSSLDLSSQQPTHPGRHLRVSLHRAGLTAAKNDLKDKSARKTPTIKNLKRVVASQSKASSPTPVKRKPCACASTHFDVSEIIHNPVLCCSNYPPISMKSLQPLYEIS